PSLIEILESAIRGYGGWGNGPDEPEYVGPHMAEVKEVATLPVFGGLDIDAIYETAATNAYAIAIRAKGKELPAPPSQEDREAAVLEIAGARASDETWLSERSQSIASAL